MIDCLIVDDEPVARNIIRNYCEQLPFLRVTAECGNALDAKEVLSAQKIDLLFLDIHMPLLNGISFLNTLKNPPVVIFTTAYQEHAVTAFDLAACDYLLKPFSLERFIIAVDKADERIQQTLKPAVGSFQAILKDYFFIRSEGKAYKIFYHDCLYAEAQGNYTKIVTIDKVISTKMTFSALTDLLPAELFIRVHRSFVVNKSMISHIEGNRVFIQQNEIPIAGNYRDDFLKAIGLY
ncbi:LytR/AlgR family response regulator transcription factor [Mucilaginibacter rubeus]|uniref:Response regulator transcription factor n=1 Tax=Mucilaginibacter rubeus TaxID=2027860 RepID=A0A5C1HZS2_9SPHI|nr:LytTR family DNA-binding domain-containing protein [Mucilaginibacter rubeus]QEM10428.1 response regulator transcription factor [Mucilaginibacter rubeus]